MYDAAGRQRKATSGDTSLVSPIRPQGILDVTLPSYSSAPVFSCNNNNHYHINCAFSSLMLIGKEGEFSGKTCFAHYQYLYFVS